MDPPKRIRIDNSSSVSSAQDKDSSGISVVSNIPTNVSSTSTVSLSTSSISSSSSSSNLPVHSVHSSVHTTGHGKSFFHKTGTSSLLTEEHDLPHKLPPSSSSSSTIEQSSSSSNSDGTFVNDEHTMNDNDNDSSLPDPIEAAYLSEFVIYKVPGNNTLIENYLHQQYEHLVHSMEPYHPSLPSSVSSSYHRVSPSSTTAIPFIHSLLNIIDPSQDILSRFSRLSEEIRLIDQHNYGIHPSIHYYTQTLEYPLTRFIHTLKPYCLAFTDASVSTSKDGDSTTVLSSVSSVSTTAEQSLRTAIIMTLNTLLYAEHGFLILHTPSVEKRMHQLYRLYSSILVYDYGTFQTVLSDATVVFSPADYASVLSICMEKSLHHSLSINQHSSIHNSVSVSSVPRPSFGGHHRTTVSSPGHVFSSPFPIDSSAFPSLTPSAALDHIRRSIDQMTSLLATKIDPSSVLIDNYPAFVWATNSGCLGAVQTWLQSSSFQSSFLTNPFFASSPSDPLHECTPYDLACSKVRYVPTANHPLRNNYTDILLLFSTVPGIPAETMLRANGSVLYWTIIAGIPDAVENILSTIPDTVTRQVMIISAATKDNVHAFESICTATHDSVDTTQANHALQIITLLAQYLSPDSIIGSGNGAPVLLHAVRAGAVDIVKQWLSHPSMNQSVINKCEVNGDLAVTLWDIVCANCTDATFTVEEQNRFRAIAHALVHAGYIEPDTLCANLKPTLAVTIGAGLYEIALGWLRNPLYHEHTLHDICTSTWPVAPPIRVRTHTAGSSSSSLTGFGTQRQNSNVLKNPVTEGLKGFRMDSSRGGGGGGEGSLNGRALSSLPSSRSNTSIGRPYRSFSSVPSVSSSSSTSMSRQLSSRLLSCSGLDSTMGNTTSMNGGDGSNDNESLFDTVAIQYRNLTLYNFTRTHSTGMYSSSSSSSKGTNDTASKKQQLLEIINEITKYTSPSMIGRNGLTSISRAIQEGLYDTVLYWLRRTTNTSNTNTGTALTSSSSSSSIRLAFHDNAVPLTGTVLLTMGLHPNAKSALMIACERVEPVALNGTLSSTVTTAGGETNTDKENRNQDGGGTIKMNTFSSLKSTETIIIPHRSNSALSVNTNDASSLPQQQAQQDQAEKGKEILTLMIKLLHPTDCDTYGTTALHTIALTGHYDSFLAWLQRYPLTDSFWRKLAHQTNTIGDTPFDCACICAAGGSLLSSNRNHLSSSLTFAKMTGNRHRRYMEGAFTIANTLAPLLPSGPATVCRDRVSALYYAVLAGLETIVHSWLDDERCTSSIIQLRNMVMNGRTVFDICCEGARCNPLVSRSGDDSSSKYSLSVYASRGIARRIATFLNPSSLCQNDTPAFFLAVGSSLDDTVERWLTNDSGTNGVDNETFFYRNKHGHTAFQNICIHTVSDEITTDDEYCQGLRTAELVGNRLTSYLSTVTDGKNSSGIDNYGWNNFYRDFYYACTVGSVKLVQAWLNLPIWSSSATTSVTVPTLTTFLTDTSSIPESSTYFDIVCDQWVLSNNSTELSTRTENYTGILSELAKRLGPLGRNKQNQYLFTVVSSLGLTDILQYFMDDPVYSQQLRNNSALVQRTLTTTANRTASMHNTMTMHQRTVSAVQGDVPDSTGPRTAHNEVSSLTNVTNLLTDYMKTHQPSLYRTPFSLSSTSFSFTKVSDPAASNDTPMDHTTITTNTAPRRPVGFGRSFSSIG